MKKYFMFVAVAAAGMLASCSSESLTAGSDPKIEPTQEERVPIQLGVSAPSVNLASGTTRGTGTVGGVGVANDDPTNVWYGQKINAFMFDKGTLDLAEETPAPAVTYFYNDALMITPGSAANIIPGQSTPTNIGEAMLSNGDIKYYPAYGNFDFFGYHGDDAITPASLTTTGDPWLVSFVINGSQDLMSTKAALTTAQTTALGGSTDFYSAKAARKEVQPILSFDHLLTRLAFEVKAGNDNAGGWVVTGTYDATTAAAYNAGLSGAVAAGSNAPADFATRVGYAPADENSLTTAEANAYNATLAGAVAAGDPDPAGSGYQDENLAVYVKSIEVKSKTTGTMAVAWTNEPANKITWDDNGTAEDPSDDGAPAWLALKERPYAYETAVTTNFISKAAYDALPATGDPGQDDYTLIGANTNYDLIALAPAYPVLTKSTKAASPDDPTPIGEALIVAPSTEVYKMKVLVSQKVPTNWTTPLVLTEKEQPYELDIPVPAGGFLKNTSYKVVLTVYGFERIEVTTEIIPWTQGSTIPVGQD